MDDIPLSNQHDRQVLLDDLHRRFRLLQRHSDELNERRRLQMDAVERFLKKQPKHIQVSVSKSISEFVANMDEEWKKFQKNHPQNSNKEYQSSPETSVNSRQIGMALFSSPAKI